MRPCLFRAGLMATLAMATATPPAQAFCTFEYNPWGGAACEVWNTEEACRALWASVLQDPQPGPKAIPVYANFDETFHETPHPNKSSTATEGVHRSLSNLGLGQDEIINQLQHAIARWNQAAAGYPVLYYAGLATGDLSDEARPNRPVGIVVESMSCWDNNDRSNALPYPPVWETNDSYAYRARIQLEPLLHGFDLPGQGEELCEELPPELWPLDDDGNLMPALYKKWTTDIHESRAQLQEVLIHELGHALGLLHNFHEKKQECGLDALRPNDLGQSGVMAYYSTPMLRPRRDDIEGMRALHRGVYPGQWPILDWFGVAGVPPVFEHTVQLEDLTTTVMPVVANQVENLHGRGAMAYADAQDRVRVRTFTDNAMDPLLLQEDLVWDAEEGRTFSPAAVAIRANHAPNSNQLFVAWNEDQASRNTLHTYWALRDLDGTSWQVFGPESFYASEGFGLENNPDDDKEGTQGADDDPRPRIEPVLGATHDPVFDDYVVVVLSNKHRPALLTIDQAGVATPFPSILEDTLGEFVAPVNAVGAPVCLHTEHPEESLCLLPVAEAPSGVATILAFRRTAAGFGGAIAWPSIDPASCPGSAACEARSTYGNITLGWNDEDGLGLLALIDPQGDVRWLEVTVGPSDSVAFADSPMEIYGNGRYSPGLLNGEPRDVVRGLTQRWPVCPYWDASSGGSSYANQPTASNWTHIVRATCLPTCGDGFVDVPPWGDEECEGDALSGFTCEDFGFDRGELACDQASCTFDLSDCQMDPPPPPDDEKVEPGGCLEVDPSCPSFTADGCYPDGPGSFGRAQVDSNIFDTSPGLYCPDNKTGLAVCGLELVGGLAEPTCFECADPGNGSGKSAYGCPCEGDTDCQPTGIGVPTGYYNGTEVELSCYAGPNQGWDGLGTCLPKIDPGSPETNSTSKELDEFERTRWLCKQSCDALSNATYLHVCAFRTASLDFTYATCVDGPCDGVPVGDCEMSGGDCSLEDTCTPQCTPDNVPGDVDCVALGYPEWWECADGWAGGGLCVPPACESPDMFGWDISTCEMFLGAEVYP